MKPKIRGWKEGTLSEDLRSIGGGAVHRKGDRVRYKRHKSIGDDRLVSDYQWYYLDLNNFNLIRDRRLLIEEERNTNAARRAKPSIIL